MRVVMGSLVGVSVRVAVAVVVMMVVLVSVNVIVGALVCMGGHRLFAGDAELRRANPSTNHRFSPD